MLKQSSVLERRPGEDLKVLGSRPSVDLRIALVKLQNSICQLLSLIIRLCYHYNNCRFTN